MDQPPPLRSTALRILPVIAIAGGCGSGSWALLGRPVSEYGKLCHGDGGHEWGDRYRMALMLTILSSCFMGFRTGPQGPEWVLK